LENIGKDDLALNVGLMLSNGRFQKPVAIKLLITDAEGHLRELQPRPFPIGGRIDPMLVPLPAGASYAVRCALGQFVIGESLQSAAQLPAGAYRIKAKYDSRDGRQFNKSEVMSLLSARHWTGTIHSADLRFDIPASP